MNRENEPAEPMLYQGSRFSIYQMTLRGEDGSSHVRDVVRHPGAVVLLPILEDGRIIMIENTRPTVRETLLELPAGTREPQESAIETAHRELIEETGYSADKLEPIHEFYSAPGISDELMHLYRATGLTEGTPDREATERIVNRIATPSEIRQWIADGRIRDAKTLVGLYAHLLDADF